MDAELTQERLKSTLRAVLKRRGHTYADVAAVWRCSLPTVKRQLGREELPLTRLLSLLEWLGLSLSEVEKLAQTREAEQKEFTAKQVEYLAANPLAFAFLFKLSDYETTPAQIGKKYGLSRKTVEQLCWRLEKYDLVKPGPGGRLRPTNKQPNIKGKLGDLHWKMILERLTHYLIRQSVGDPNGHESGMAVHTFRISKKTFRTFKRRALELVTEVRDSTALERDRLPDSELEDGCLFLSLTLARHGAPEYALVDDPFGEFLREPS